MTIPPVIVAFGALWNLIAWVWFARAFKLIPLMFLAIPFCVVTTIYGWFSLVDVPVNLRADWVRLGLFMIVFAQGPVLSVMALLKSRGKRHDA